MPRGLFHPLSRLAVRPPPSTRPHSITTGSFPSTYKCWRVMRQAVGSINRIIFHIYLGNTLDGLTVMAIGLRTEEAFGMQQDL
jgi:hypothetical protein